MGSICIPQYKLTHGLAYITNSGSWCGVRQIFKLTPATLNVPEEVGGGDRTSGLGSEVIQILVTKTDYATIYTVMVTMITLLYKHTHRLEIEL